VTAGSAVAESGAATLFLELCLGQLLMDATIDQGRVLGS